MTPEEVAGLAQAMRAKCVPVFAGPNALDICGTGGDGIGSVNISTGQSFKPWRATAGSSSAGLVSLRDVHMK